MAAVKVSAAQTLLIQNNSAKNFDFVLPSSEVEAKPWLNGNLAIQIKTTKGLGTNSDGLKIELQPIVNGVVMSLPKITLVAALDWATTESYLYPVQTPFGPCTGCRVIVTYANGSIGVEEMTVDVSTVTE